MKNRAYSQSTSSKVLFMTSNTHLNQSTCLMLASAMLPTDDMRAELTPFADEDKFALLIFSLNCSIDPYAYEIYIKTTNSTYRHLVASTTNNTDLQEMSKFIFGFVSEYYQSLSIAEKVNIIHQTFSICESAVTEDAIKKMLNGSTAYDQHFVIFEGRTSLTADGFIHHVVANLYKDAKQTKTLSSDSLASLLDEHRDTVVAKGVYSDIAERVIVRGGATKGSSANSDTHSLHFGYEGETTADRFSYHLDAAKRNRKSGVFDAGGFEVGQ